jgi:C1A family cysteine protease
MPKPDWNAKQKPHEKSKDHGKHDAEHGPHEHGLGGQRDPNHEHGPKQAPDDLTIQEPEDGADPATPELEAGAEPLVAITAYPAIARIANVPPITDQGTTPMCVAYSNAYDQNQQDRPEMGKFENFDEPKFFYSIGGGPNGSYMSAGLDRRTNYGYPEQDSTPSPGSHRIAGYTQIDLTVAAIKQAIYANNHGLLVIGDWFHSWFHPFVSGKLPAPDYVVGGHAYWFIGWNDKLGFRLHQTWGPDYGVSGDVYMPYAFLSRAYAAYRTTDK